MSLLAFLNDLSVAKDASDHAASLSLAFRIAEQCDDPEDVAESALWLIARDVETDAKRNRDLAAQAERSARLYGTGTHAQVEYAGTAAELESLVRRIRAALEPAQPVEKAA